MSSMERSWADHSRFCGSVFLFLFVAYFSLFSLTISKIIVRSLQISVFCDYSYPTYCLFMGTIVTLKNKDLTWKASEF